MASASTATTPWSPSTSQPARARTEGEGDRVDARGVVPLHVDDRVGDREGRPGVRGGRDEHEEHAGQAAGGPVPAEHRAAAGSPRRTGATRASCPSPAGRTSRRSRARPRRGPAAPGRRRGEQQPEQRGAHDDRPRRVRTSRGRRGSACRACRSASTGASTRSLSAPIANWRSVIDSPEARRRVRACPARDERDQRDDDPVEDRRERVDQASAPSRPRRAGGAAPAARPREARRTRQRVHGRGPGRCSGRRLAMPWGRRRPIVRRRRAR